MSVTLSVTQHITFTVGNEVKTFGSLTTPVEISLTTGLVHETRAVVADDYAEQTLWTSGDGGLDTFEFLWFLSDADVLLEFADVAGTECFAIQVKANVPFILSYDDILVSDSAASIVTGDVATMKTINRILVHNNGAEAIGDATVHLVLGA